MTINHWDQKGIPHKDWTCIGCEDLDRPIGKCQMCGKEEIRYVHSMRHSNYEQVMTVGIVCAQKMENDSIAPKIRERQLRNKAKSRTNWLKRKWRHSEKGNEYLNVKSVNIVIFSKQKLKWSFKIDSEFSKKTYETSDEAKLGAFDKFFDKSNQQSLNSVDLNRNQNRKFNSEEFDEV